MPKLLKSRFFYSVIVFGAISLLAGSCKLWQSQATDYPYRSWTAWAIDDFLHQKRAPQLVFLGSSLVLVPLDGIDADYLNHRIDGAAHHKSTYFEEAFARKASIPTRTFNFALPGEMPSDAYMINNFLLKDGREPDVIVWGVGPRDFMDNLLPSPASTDPFRFLSRFGDINNVASLMMPEWTERFNYELGRAIYLYGRREDVARNLTNVATADINRLVPLPAGVKPMPTAEVKKMLPELRPFEVGLGEAFFRPVPLTEKAEFLNNVQEYRRRYKNLKWDTFRAQMSFFSKSLEIARQHGTKVIVVGMPITDINRSLLSDYALKTYKETVGKTASSQGASFIDLTDDPRFTRADFGDTVHLHARGGLRWMNILVDRLSADQDIVAALRKNSGVASTSTPDKGLKSGSGGPL